MSMASTFGWAQTVQRLGMVWPQGFVRLRRLRLKPSPMLAGQLRGGPLDASCLFENKGAARRPVLISPSRVVASHRLYVARLENPGSFSLAGEDLLLGFPVQDTLLLSGTPEWRTEAECATVLFGLPIGIKT